MKKEKLYLDYQNQCDLYRKKGKGYETLKSFKGRFVSVLDSLGINGTIVGETEYNADRDDEESFIKYVEDRINEIENISEEIRKFEESELKDFENFSDLDKYVEAYSEKIKEKCEKEKIKELSEIQDRYDTQIESIRSEISTNDKGYEKELRKQLGHVEKNHQLMDLHANLSDKKQKGELPSAILNTLKNSPSQIVSKNKIESGKQAADLAGKAKSLDDLESFAPAWLSFTAKILIPVLIGAFIFIVMQISGVRFNFVYGATDFVASLLVKLLIAAVVFGIGTLIGSFIFIENGYIVGIIAGIIAFILSRNIHIYVPYEFSSKIELIFRIVIGVGVVIGTRFLFNMFGVYKLIIRAGMKSESAKASALERQGEIVKEYADSYYILINYKAVITEIVDKNSKRQNSPLANELKELSEKKESELAAASDRWDNELSNKIADASKYARESIEKYIEHKNRAHVVEGVLNGDLKLLDEMINSAQGEIAPILDNIHGIMEDLYKNTVSFEESQGIMSDQFYVFDEQSKSDPVELIEIKHDKKPIVFLYDIDDNTNVANSLEKFILSVVVGILSINSSDVVNISITDPVSQARNLSKFEKDGIIKIENDIRDFSEKINKAMSDTAREGLNIDDFNRKMSEEGEDKVKFKKYNIAQFIVPEEEAAHNSNFFDSALWGTLGDGKNWGFIPIFYISFSDWNNTFDDENRMNSRFIRDLKRAIGTTNGSVYKIDPHTINLEKISLL